MRINVFNPKEQKKMQVGTYKKQGDYTAITSICIIVIAVIIGFIVFKSVRNGKCLSIEEQVMTEAMAYIEKNNLLPSYEGDSITINIDEIDTLSVVLEGNICSGTVTITLAEGRYIKTFDIQNCSYCTTKNRYNWSSKKEKYPKNKSLVSVEMVFNYYDVTYNYTPWTDWFSSDLIDAVPSEYDINMPLNSKKWPTISDAGELITYETEKKTFYSYRDKKWKFYKYLNNDYSDFSSTRPDGYTYKDERTKIETEPTEWSTNYPEEFDYRKISSTRGYRWYYETKDGVKIYYKDGIYIPEVEEELQDLYTEKEKDSVKMYRYVDSLWRWYNGTARNYSGFMAEATTSYPYKDEEIVDYTSWSRWSEVSNVNSSNQTYREQKTDTHQRYRAYYLMHSNEKLNNYLNLADFENITGRTLEDMQNDDSIKVLIKYEYRYGK